MKTIIVASLISLVVVVGGYLVYLKQIMKKTADVTTEQVSYTAYDVKAIEFAMLGMESRQREMTMAEAEHRSLSSTLQVQAAALEEERGRLQALLDKVSTQTDEITANQEAALTRLAKVYEAMKPAEAAQIASGLSTELLVEILPRMKDRSAAKLIAGLDTSKAVMVTQKLGYSTD